MITGVETGTVVGVDDDEALLRLLYMRLTAANHDVITAESGEQALAQLALCRPHLVITDLRMEGMDGLALFDAIEEHVSKRDFSGCMFVNAAAEYSSRKDPVHRVATNHG